MHSTLTMQLYALSFFSPIPAQDAYGLERNQKQSAMPRWCPCGTRLNSYNKSDTCLPCQQKKIDRSPAF